MYLIKKMPIFMERGCPLQRSQSPTIELHDFKLSSPPRSDWLWGPSSLLSNGYRG